MDGVLELGTTDSVLEDPDLANRATTPFRELQFPACTEEPNSSPSVDETREASDIIVFEDVDHNAAMEPMISEGHERGKFFTTECLPDANFEEVTMEIDELYNNFCEGLDVQLLEDDWISIDGLLEAPPSLEPAPEAATDDGDGDHTLSKPVDGSRFLSSFKAWTRPESDRAAAPATAGAPQKMLKKVVSGGAWWASNGGDESTAWRTATQESGITKSHVMSERRRREKLNEMFLVLKSLIPSTRKVDKASILAETIAYLRELERRVQELESSKELSTPRPAAGALRHHDAEVVGTRKAASGGAKRKKKGSELDAGDRQMERHYVGSSGGPSNVSIAVADKEVLLDVQCRWKERLMARVFDAVKSLHLNIVSVQSSTLDGLMGLKVRAQFASSAAVAPGMIIEALQEAISSRT
ncbi:hypothetical protein PAHAL_3G434200 [Panicum hallii]|uniref:BHLH domain-containing protein n=2 Tax=Panicum hallii TaxID=206008 RepID=A0A2S3HEH6_9POAL|nr:hypothetical protein PAHAL_3G434200 [Panicum hallii]